MRIDLCPGSGGELDRKLPHASRCAVHQDLASKQKTTLAKGMQSSQSWYRQACRLCVRHAFRNDGDRIQRSVYAFGPCSDWQHADNATSHVRSTLRLAGFFDDAGKIPSGAGSGFGNREGALGLAAVERDRCDTDCEFAERGRREVNCANREPRIFGSVDGDGFDLIGAHDHFILIGRSTVTLNGPLSAAACATALFTSARSKFLTSQLFRSSSPERIRLIRRMLASRGPSH